MSNNFFAMMSRMKYIDRWALMRNSYTENISEHSLEVSMLTHALCVIGNKRLGKKLDAEKAVLVALYHDASEIITGDMPTPIKYLNKDIKGAFKDIEAKANLRLLDMLPEDLKEDYQEIFFPKEDMGYELKLVKAADKLSALIKCIEEEKMGNLEFKSAGNTLQNSIIDMHLEEADIFMKEFLPAYHLTLDELNEK
ncbi:MAG: 5'-deoxynucleotidase [Lachnospiraceae bacterium]|nr:5'-deoxynucleotidase [Lachnospiraceae bacterium]MBR6474863.1 5'-deoxynucleotidase [Lachnospiraceae bacterium]